MSEARPLAEQGHAVAQGLLGVMYENGQGVQKDYREALGWYRKAADQGMAPAEFSLGLAYATGHEVPKNDGKRLPGIAARRNRTTHPRS
jgi:TPR repeat protein